MSLRGNTFENVAGGVVMIWGMDFLDVLVYESSPGGHLFPKILFPNDSK